MDITAHIDMFDPEDAASAAEDPVRSTRAKLAVRLGIYLQNRSRFYLQPGEGGGWALGMLFSPNLTC
jgi:hypothetical protein